MLEEKFEVLFQKVFLMIEGKHIHEVAEAFQLVFISSIYVNTKSS